jgi:hypothetical protein
MEPWVIGIVCSVAFPICTGMAATLRPAAEELRLHPVSKMAMPSAPDAMARTMRALLTGGLEALVVCMVESLARRAGPAPEEVALDDQ